MKFREYLPKFEGDLWEEGRRRMGDKIGDYTSMQYNINIRDSNVAAYKEFIKKFCALSVATGMNELLLSVDACSELDSEEISNEIEGATATDLGCCDGTITLFYALNHPQVEFTGIDLCREAVDKAKENAKLHTVNNVRFVCADAMSDETSQYFSADTLIVQGSAYQILPNTYDYNALFLHHIKPKVRRGSKIILSQAIPKPDERFRPRTVEGYEIVRYSTRTVREDTLNANLTTEIAVFRRV